jgi:hypothetical protein
MMFRQIHSFFSGLSSLVVLFAVVATLGSDAHAYIDPGTGSLILQAVLGGVAGAGFLIKLYWGKIKALVFRNRSDS